MRRALSIAALGLCLGSSMARAQMGTAFTYQGRLTDGGGPANGIYDFQLVLYNAPVGGAQQGPIVTREDVTVTEGLFTVKLDFGLVFYGGVRYLDVPCQNGYRRSIAPRRIEGPCYG